MLGRKEHKVWWALLQSMKPMARLMLRNGIGYKEFSSVVKQAFVDVATSDYGIRGRPTNISRVAVMTGLTRKEVKKVREMGTVDIDSLSMLLNPQAEILHYWHTDKKYLDANGKPRQLNFDGPGDTFSQLSKKYAGDIPPGAMRMELKRVGAIAENEDGTLVVRRRDYVSAEADDRLVEGLGSSLGNLISTIAFNSQTQNIDETRFEKCVYNMRIAKTKIGVLRTDLKRRLMSLAIELDDVLSDYEIEPEDETAKFDGEVGVGIYYYEKNVPS